MTTIGSSLQQGMAVLQQMLGAPMFIWEGTSIRCIPAAVNDANVPISGGFQDNVTSRILVMFSDWKTCDSTLVSMDSTLRSNLTVGLPVDLLVYKKDALAVDIRRRIGEDDPYFRELREQWSTALREAYLAIPRPDWAS